jgi:hypothetical protein
MASEVRSRSTRTRPEEVNATFDQPSDTVYYGQCSSLWCVAQTGPLDDEYKRKSQERRAACMSTPFQLCIV